MKKASIWLYGAVLVASAIAWLLPDFIRGAAGDLGVIALQLMGVLACGSAFLAIVVAVAHHFSTPAEIRRHMRHTGR